ncbi:MAG: Y-family DNA polymerase [Paludibacteraceae bacterium]|nr:Y-family DNA polymerase [Paludibacteraceae bacterium]
MYALADCNNFFVSCERIFRPDLWNKPVLVLSGNDGCVISRSNEVKALGIKMGAPYFQISGLVAQYGITCFSTNFALYGDISTRVMSILRRHTFRMEQYSVDEGFFSVEHIPLEQRRTYCEQIVKEVYQGVGIPISIGIARSKTLAKVASKYAKKYPGYHGACMIDTDRQRQIALENFEIGDVWGIGRKARAKLETVGIKTAWEFATKREEFARNLLHKPGMLTWRELNGVDCIDTSEVVAKQSISYSRTFATGISDLTLLEQQLANFCDSCARKLRLQHSVCSQMMIYAYTSRFRTDIMPCYLSQTVKLPVPTANTQELLAAALSILRTQFTPGVMYKKAGVVLMQIQPDKAVLTDLFDNRDREKDNRLQQTLDTIRDKCGSNSILLGPQLQSAEMEKTAIYKAENRSPLYTTDLAQILRVKA